MVLNLATDCLMKVTQEINNDGSKKVGIITDHGHRGGQDIFFIVYAEAAWIAMAKEQSNFSTQVLTMLDTLLRRLMMV